MERGDRRRLAARQALGELDREEDLRELATASTRVPDSTSRSSSITSSKSIAAWPSEETLTIRLPGVFAQQRQQLERDQEVGEVVDGEVELVAVGAGLALVGGDAGVVDEDVEVAVLGRDLRASVRASASEDRSAR